MPSSLVRSCSQRALEAPAREAGDRVSSKTARAGQPRIVPRPEHPISRRDFSEGALKVLYRLHKAGYTAYLVGGAVRDLLLGRRPKDFDVVTNARPREVRRLFRNSRIIGRRFRLVHVMFRREIVEVSTFRAMPGEPEPEEPWEEGEIHGENGDEEEPEIYGSPAEDAFRRDFTMNALFYDISDFSIIDHPGGLEDIERRVIRTIGDPDERFREDPVRMMRALEYAVRLGFDLDPEAAAAIARNRDELREAAPARLTYEVGEALRSQHAAGIFRELDRNGLLEMLLPEAAEAGQRLLPVLERLDVQVQDRGPAPEPVLLGATFLPGALNILIPMLAEGRKVDNPVLIAELTSLLDPAGARMHLPKGVVHLMHHGLFALSKLSRPPSSGRQVLRLVRQDYFPVAWALFDLWVHAADGPRSSWKAWSRAVQQVREKGEKADLGSGTGREGRARPKRRPRRRRRRR